MCIWEMKGTAIEGPVTAYKVLRVGHDGILLSPDYYTAWNDGRLVADEVPVVARHFGKGPNAGSINGTSGIYAFKKKRGAKSYKNGRDTRIVKLRLSGVIIFHEKERGTGRSNQHAGYRAQKAEIITTRWWQRA